MWKEGVGILSEHNQAFFPFGLFSLSQCFNVVFFSSLSVVRVCIVYSHCSFLVETYTTNEDVLIDDLF